MGHGARRGGMVLLWCQAAASSLGRAQQQRPAAPAISGRSSVLLIVADDMRPELGCYGCAHMKTPNIDSLAADAVTFTAAYVAVAWCSPSRTALLVSRNPDTSRTWSVSPSEYWRQRGGNFSTLPQLFKSQGYLTLGVGKVFHPGGASGSDDHLYSWSKQSLPYDDVGTRCPSASSRVEKAPAAPPPGVEGAPLYESSQKGNAMGPGPNQDTAMASCAVRTLQHLANRSDSSAAPFFFAVGFHKPRAHHSSLFLSLSLSSLCAHGGCSDELVWLLADIPWDVPQNFYDLYPLSEIALAPSRNLPTNVPAIAPNQILAVAWPGDFSDMALLRQNGSIQPNGTVADYWARRIRQSYWAALTFTDENVGEVLHAARQTGLYTTSVIAFLGDHGFQLGDHNQWSKVTNWEHSLRIPLIIKPPTVSADGQALNWGGIGKLATGMAQAVDLFPSLVELAMPGAGAALLPRCPDAVLASRATELCTDGISLVPALREPTASLQPIAFSQVPRNAAVDGMQGSKVARKLGELFMGYSLRGAHWRYTEWFPFDPERGAANWSSSVGVEMYEHRPADTAMKCSWSCENENVAEQHQLAPARAKLATLLRQHF